MNNISDKKLEDMWREFGDTAIDEEDKIIIDFYTWKKGTDRFEIWHWFDEMHTKGLARGLMYRKPKVSECERCGFLDKYDKEK